MIKRLGIVLSQGVQQVIAQLARLEGTIEATQHSIRKVAMVLIIIVLIIMVLIIMVIEIIARIVEGTSRSITLSANSGTSGTVHMGTGAIDGIFVGHALRRERWGKPIRLHPMRDPA